MHKKMNTKQAKQICLASFLAHIGFTPTKVKNHTYWYISPLRTKERTPSFKVEINKNFWYDFGLGKGGTIIDFVRDWLITEDISVVLQFIEKNTPAVFDFRPLENKTEDNFFSFQKQKEHQIKSDITFSELTDERLFSYLSERGISRQLGKLVQQATIKRGENEYTVLAFRNDRNGYELRNKYYKSCTSKSITSIEINSNYPVYVFEGFMDFLSLLEIHFRKENNLNFRCRSNFIILNSVSQLKIALPKLKLYPEIHLYMDNDEAGKSASSQIKNVYPGAIDCSGIYEKFKDLNDYLVSRNI